MAAAQNVERGGADHQQGASTRANSEAAWLSIPGGRCGKTSMDRTKSKDPGAKGRLQMSACTGRWAPIRRAWVRPSQLMSKGTMGQPRSVCSNREKYPVPHPASRARVIGRPSR